MSETWVRRGLPRNTQNAAPQRTLYSVGRLPCLVQAAAELEARLGWTPAYWITQPELEDRVAERFPEAVRHDFSLANRGESDPVPSSDRPASDVGAFLGCGHLFAQGMEIVSRHVLGNVLSHDQKVDYLLDRLDYALGTTRALDLQVFVLNGSPHCPIDFAFYTAFKLLGRKVRILHLTGFRGLSVVLPDPESAPLGLGSAEHSGGHSLSQEAHEELERLRASSVEDVPWYVEVQREREEKHAHLYRIADDVLKSGRYPPGTVSFDAVVEREVETRAGAPHEADAVVSGSPRNGDEPPAAPPVTTRTEDAFKRRYQEKHDLPMVRALARHASGFGAAPITWREYYTYRDWALLTKRRWFHEYEALASDFDLEASTSGPYAFFAMHYQPERTTCPEGGVFSNQLAALRMIVRTLPAGWRLLVKEHPSQFLWQTEGELGRWDGYHQTIRDLGLVDLVPLEVSAKRLVQGAGAVVTVTGTVGWEACLAGIPTITLARPWYDAEGVTLGARNPGELRAAFQRIESGWRPSDTAIVEHLARIELAGRRCYMNPSHAPHFADLTEEENVRNIVDLFESAELASERAECGSSR
jgi:hypothetical protein